jgi:ATP synthase, Delta/Epsilon chain, beta-sandwich domain
VTRIVAETHEGSLGLLPHRLDCVAALVPGILVYETEAEGEVYLERWSVGTQRLCGPLSANIYSCRCSGRALNRWPARTPAAWLPCNAPIRTSMNCWRTSTATSIACVKAASTRNCSTSFLASKRCLEAENRPDGGRSARPLHCRSFSQFLCLWGVVESTMSEWLRFA